MFVIAGVIMSGFKNGIGCTTVLQKILCSVMSAIKLIIKISYSPTSLKKSSFLERDFTYGIKPREKMVKLLSMRIPTATKRL